tara:strand:+ start:13 stop:1122 length:1110 start_codon:yes stop_codon:yes gene_type:complete
MIIEYLFYIFLVATVIQLLYHVLIFIRIWFYKQSEPVNYKPVSVIVSSKNQLNDLRSNLIYFLDQDYPQFEVIVINDASSDGTDDYLEELEKKYDHLKVVTNTIQENDRFNKGKKFGITLAIKSALHDTLLFSDADSYPFSNQWIKKMQSSFSSNNQIVLAYSRLEKRKGLLNRLLRYESLYEGLLSFSFTLSGFPLLAQRRNLGYDRTLFFSINGFFSHLNLSRGEAKLFVDEASDSRNANVCLSPEGMILSNKQKSYLEWFSDKRSDFHLAKRLRFSSLMFLRMNFFSQFSFWILFPILLIYQIDTHLVLMVFTLRFFLQYIVYWKMCKFTNEYDLLWFLPFYEISLMLIHLILSLSTFIKKVHDWD